MLERASLARKGPPGVFGWVDITYLPGVAWLAAGPGIMGHTSFAALLRWLHPLQVRSLRSRRLHARALAGTVLLEQTSSASQVWPGNRGWPMRHTSSSF